MGHNSPDLNLKAGVYFAARAPPGDPANGAYWLGVVVSLEKDKDDIRVCFYERYSVEESNGVATDILYYLDPQHRIINTASIIHTGDLVMMKTRKKTTDNMPLLRPSIRDIDMSDLPKKGAHVMW
eukprot:TRINITY_DN12714_c0_g1_i2.p1 TRINITY_DN12714_c0_g1~~TRINITY_DN12714_c0_g1_i2.p1  ORF type:complete len:125 (+),score=31.48 TRINITY_DN12714_c0_g1_i2:558-932(+)